MASIKVFGSPTSTEVSRVLACLFEKDVDFQLIHIDTYNGVQRIPDPLKSQPHGQALTFEDGKTTLVESRRICRHISEKFPERGNKMLLGKGMLERSAIEQWLLAEEQNFDPPSASLVFHLAFATDLIIGKEKEKELVENEKLLARVLDTYERKLGETQYLAGDDFTLADLSHLPNSHYLVNKAEKKYLFENRENVWRWWTEISQRPSWKKVVQMQNEPPALPGNDERNVVPLSVYEVVFRV
ncbi:Glutathione S-transferase F11 [Acorus calamus]|uniref:glutathione transferase n=1 Tax=Acorus calamus TaxID=4465 RepID=A0AAV9DT39_ACOCL|nr:Glutathione S-transferase F11 [Acorus calamus]